MDARCGYCALCTFALFLGGLQQCSGLLVPTVLRPDKQLVLQYPRETVVVNGPGFTYYSPLIASASLRDAVLIDEQEYLYVMDTSSGQVRVEEGPKLFFLKAFDRIDSRRKKVSLTDGQYIHVLDQATGASRTVSGPGTFVAMPLEQMVGPRDMMVLRKEQYLVVLDKASGVRRLVTGPCTFVPQPMDEATGPHAGIRLAKHEYVKLQDTATGKVRMEIGEQLVFPEPTESEVQRAAAMVLQKNQYVLLRDTASGVQRMVKGEGQEKLVFPGPMEEFVGKVENAWQLNEGEYIRLLDRASGQERVEIGVQVVFPTVYEEASTGVLTAIDVDDETAALVRSKQSGQLRLVTEPGKFYPTAQDEDPVKQSLIRVAAHEVVCVLDEKNDFHFYYGSSGNSTNGISFFLPPHHKIFTMLWSSSTDPADRNQGIDKKLKTLAYKAEVKKFFTWPLHAFFQYNVTTKDNVGLMVDGMIEWQIVDVPKMVRSTGDPKGDVWLQSRSRLSHAISQVTLAQFMSNFKNITDFALTSTEQRYFNARGVKVNSIEIIEYNCRDSRTAAILQNSTAETTEQLNKMKQQERQVAMDNATLQAEIELERERAKLIEERGRNQKDASKFDGEAQGLTLARQALTFLELLNTSVPDAAERVALFKFFEAQRALVERTGSLAGGNATLFLTPEDMQLKLLMPTEQKGSIAANHEL